MCHEKRCREDGTRRKKEPGQAEAVQSMANNLRRKLRREWRRNTKGAAFLKNMKKNKVIGGRSRRRVEDCTGKAMKNMIIKEINHK
jgi:hypothetical protein